MFLPFMIKNLLMLMNPASAVNASRNLGLCGDLPKTYSCS